jgi:predicted transcriptional regulator
MPRFRVSERELEVMQALWRCEREASVAEVQRSMAEAGGELAYTTVQTMLNRLAAKGQVRRRLDGRTCRYAPAVKEPVATRAALRTLVDRFFGGSAAELAAHLVEREMSDAELDRVEALLAQRKRREP